MDFLEAKFKRTSFYQKAMIFLNLQNGIAEENSHEKKISSDLTKQDYLTDIHGDIGPNKTRYYRFKIFILIIKMQLYLI